MGFDNRFNGLFSSHFRRCKLLTTIEDHNRKRVIKVFAIPGDRSIVGFFDGVDTWVGSATKSFRGVDLAATTGELITTKPIRPRHALIEDKENQA